MANIARFWPEKAQDVLLAAMARVVKTRPEARLWLVGIGPEQERMQELSRQLGLESCVSFLGFRKDLPELLALVDLQVHPSDMEGVPLAICSGMAAGLPIIATSVGGLVEVLEDGQSAVLVPPRQPERLAQAIVSLMSSPETRSRLAQKCCQIYRAGVLSRCCHAPRRINLRQDARDVSVRLREIRAA